VAPPTPEKIMNDKTVNLPLSLLDNLLQYLGTKPYAEVYQLVAAMQQAVTPQLQEPEVEASNED